MILAVTGLEREARVISRPDIVTVVGGSHSHTLGDRIRAALDGGGARRILSIGICGALCPTLEVGACVVATEIVSGGERLPTHPQWTKELLTSLPHARSAVIAGSDRIVAHKAEKTRLHQDTGALAADMESHIAGRVAQERGLPFAVVRVVSDSSRQSLPPAALIAMSETGRVNVRAVMQSLFARPHQIPALVRTAWEAEKAFRALFSCRHVLGTGLVAADLGELSLDVS
jgi:hopanoid-associated phosphorylase